MTTERRGGARAARPAVAMFTKPARPGTVKTRLIGAVTPEAAARLHLAFVEDLGRRLAEASFELFLAWAGTPPPTPPVPVAGIVEQGEGDLGARLWRVLSALAAEGRMVAAVGSDHPDLDPTLLETAFHWLADGDTDVVLGPTPDGGYYTLATRPETLERRLFEEVPWSTAEVLAVTEARCLERGLRCRRLPVGPDVDRPEDLRALLARLRDAPGRCPATESVLRDIGWWSGEEVPV